MFSSKRNRRFCSIALCVAMTASIVPIHPGKVWAATSAPVLSGIQVNDHVKLQWGVDIPDSDIIFKTSFEDGEELPSFSSSNQAIVTGGAASGQKSLQLSNTTERNYAAFQAKHVPNGSAISISFKAKASVGSITSAEFTGEGGLRNKGFEIKDKNNRILKFNEVVDFSNPPSSISLFVDGGEVALDNGAWWPVVSSANTNYRYGIVYYHWDQAEKKLLKNAGESTPRYFCDNFDNCNAADLVKDVFHVGDPVLSAVGVTAKFPTKSLLPNNTWTTLNSNAMVDDANYDFDLRGLKPYVWWQTNGSTNIDDLKMGYAQHIQVFRNDESIPIYQGYLASEFEDLSAKDYSGPEPPTSVTASAVNRYPYITWSPSSGDNGSNYSYHIKSTSPTGGNSLLSETVPVVVTSGLKGYSIVLDTNPSTIPDNYVETTGTSFSWSGQVSSNFFVHVAAVDNQGNISSVVHKEYTDTVQPSLTITPSTTSWTSADVALTATGTDNETGINSIQKPDGSWVVGGTASFVATTNGDYTFVSKDNAGNTRSSTFTVTNIDKTAPTVPTIDVNPSSWTADNVTVTLTDGSDNQSGVQKSQYKLGVGGAWTDYASPFTISSEGQTDIFAQTIDKVGNISSQVSSRAQVDKSGPAAPTITLSNSDWTNQDVEVTVENGTDGLSGISKSQYRLGATGPWVDYTVPLTISTEGETEVFARTLDQVGNVSTSVMQTVRIDKTAPSDPSITLSQSTWTQNPVTFSIGGSSDRDDSILYQYKIGSDPYTIGATGIVTQDGMTTVTAQAMDRVGNKSREISKNIFIDKTAPSIDISPNGMSWTSNDVNVSINYADAHSGIDANTRFYKVSNSAAAPSSWETASSNEQNVSITTEGIWYVHAKVTDLAGNSYETITDQIQLQRQPLTPANIRVSNVTETTAELTFDLPSSEVYTEGYRYTVTNTTTGKTWTLSYPDHVVQDTSLVGGKSYTYTVKAQNHVGTSSDSTMTALTLPGTPANVVVEKVGTTYGEAKVSFNPVESATGYRILAKDPSSTITYNQTVTDTVYQSITGLHPGTLYSISVSAMNGSGEGAARNVGFLTLPDAPNSFSAVQISEHNIRLNWNTVISATYYHLTRDGYNIYGGPEQSFFDIGMESGTSYHYGLNASNATGSGALSELELMTLPTKVEQLQITNPTTDKLHLRWNPVRGAGQYIIQMDSQLFQTVGSGTTELTVSGLLPGTTHTFEVHAANASGAGESSTVTGSTIPASATGLQAIDIGETTATLTWSPVAGASKYRLAINGQVVEVGTNQHSITSLSGSQPYSFTVEAGNGSGFGALASGNFLTLPYTPRNIGVSETTESTIGLNWEAVEHATSYVVTLDGHVIGMPTEPSFVADNLTSGTAFTFHVNAVNASGEGQKSRVDWMTKPSAPAAPVVEPNAYNANVTWSAVTGATQYVIEDGSKELYRGSDTVATLTGLADGQTYNFTIRGVNANGSSSSTRVFSFLTLPKKPVAVTGQSIEKDQLQLDLSKTEVVGADRFIIGRDGTEVGSVPASNTSFIDTGLSPGTKYVYSVKAANASGSGETYSLSLTTKTETVPVGSIQVLPGTHTAVVTWEAVQGGVSYQIRNTVTGEVYNTSDTSVTLVNLQDGSSSTFELTASNESGVVSEGARFDMLTKPVSPATAKLGMITDTTIDLDLTGSGVRGADEFVIVRDGEEIGRVPADQFMFKDKELKPGSEYTYVIKTANASGTSDNGFTMIARTVPKTITTPAVPKEITPSSVTINWDEAEGASGYRVIVGNAFYTITDKTSVTIEGLQSAKSHDNIWIVPFNDSGDAVPIRTLPFHTLPLIEGLKVVAISETDLVSFTWELPTLHEIFVLTTQDGKEVYRGSDRKFILEGLEAGKTYVVTFHTENTAGDKSRSLPYSVLTKPQAPNEVGYISTSNSIVLYFSQSAMQGAEEYVIERDGTEIGRVSVTAAAYEIPDLLPGITYSFKVKSSNGSGKSDEGYLITATVLPSSISTPPKPDHPATEGFEITWDAALGATGYKVYIGDKLVLNTAETKVTLAGLESAKLYDNVHVVPYNDGGNGESIAVPAFATLPNGEFSAEAVSKGTNKIEVKWALASQNETFVLEHDGKELYRGKNRSYEWTGLQSGRNYTVTIWTEGPSGVKSASKTLNARTQEEYSSGSGGDGGGVPIPVVPKEPVEGHEKPKPEPTPTPKPGKKPLYFEDIEATFNKEQITLLAEQGVIQGVSATRFEPLRPITRAEFTALIVRLMQVKVEGKTETGFNDVLGEDWFAPEIAAAVKNGFVDGMGSGIFAPNLLVTREQATKILANVVKRMAPNKQVEEIAFVDQEQISGWAEAEVRFLAGMQMVLGYEDGTFRPLNDLNRAEAAALIFRLKELQKELQ